MKLTPTTQVIKIQVKGARKMNKTLKIMARRLRRIAKLQSKLENGV
jgi:hypothetical protein